MIESTRTQAWPRGEKSDKETTALPRPRGRQIPDPARTNTAVAERTGILLRNRALMSSCRSDSFPRMRPLGEVPKWGRDDDDPGPPDDWIAPCWRQNKRR